MSEEFKDFTATPTLTLNPVAEESAVPAMAQETRVQPNEAGWDDSMLSAEEKQMVVDFSKQIDLKNSNLIMQYGAGAQKKMADFSEKALDNVKTQDLGEVGDLLSGVVSELKSFDAEEERGVFGFFKKSANKITAMKAKYAKAETNINKICQVLEGHQVQLMKDAATLDKMYELNKTYFKELSMYILAGKKKLKEVREGELAQITAKAQQEKIQSTIVNTVPLWKSQMVLALGVEHSTQAAAAQRQVTDMTNELLRKNAATLKTATIETAKESERGIVDMETLKITNESLISTLDEVMRIQQEGRQKRQEAEVEMARMESELKTKLLQISG